jgi:chemotaxis protein MotB
MRNFNIILLALVTMFILDSCVSKSKYEAVVSSRDSLELIVDSLDLVIEGLENNLNNELNTNKKYAENIKNLQAELINAKDNYNKLKNRSSSETQELLTQVEDLQAEKIKLNYQLTKTGEQLDEIKRLLAQRDEKINNLKNTIAKALVGFADKGLTVNIKNGKVYVSLSNQLLFSSGSIKIDEQGKSAIKDLAIVLNQNPDINILVEGHTDDQAVSGGSRFKDNWELSVLRATEVSKFLQEEGQVDPTRIIASGRSEYIPIEVGSTPEARAVNRRTEIILTPNLEEIFEVIK